MTVDSLQLGEIRVRGDFVDQATATGALVIVYSLSNDSDVHYNNSKRSVDKSSDKNVDINVTSLTGTQYGVSVFALDNGLPFPRVVTLPVIVDVDQSENQSMIV